MLIDASKIIPELGLAQCRDLLAMVGGHVAILDRQGRIRWANRTPTGVEPGTEFEDRLLDLVVPEQRRLVGEALDDLVAGGSAVTLELCGTKTGRWYSVRLDGIRRGGEVTGLFLHAVDIDEAKRDAAELAIRRARHRASGLADKQPGRPDFEVIADALPVLISYVDSDRRYQYNNAPYERWFGVSREQLRGRSLEEVLGPAAYAAVRGHVDAALGGQAVRFEMTLPYKDAGLRRVIAHYVPDVDTTGEVLGFFALIDDVSAQREAEAALAQREEQLQQVLKLEALGRLAGGIAHEFGNLLMTIISGCTAITEGAAETTDMVATIKRAAQRGTSLTRQLLAFSSARDTAHGPVEIDAIVGDVVVLLDRLLGRRIELEIDLCANVMVSADAGQIQQVLMNLAINARDAMPDGGRLRVVTTLIELEPMRTSALANCEPGRYALLTVRDTGTGMEPHTQARIFEPFFTTKAPGEGSGLGLSTVFGVVRQAGGFVEVDSAPGLGSVFRVYLPVVEAPERV